MTKPNRMMTAVNRTKMLPVGMRSFVLSKLFGNIVPLVGTAGIRFESLTSNECVVTIANKRKVQNHIKGVHAASAALLAETATGFVTGMNIPDERVMLIKSLHVDYLKVSKGSLKAVATLTDEQRKMIQDSEKGELVVPVVITDEAGQNPSKATMLWAWIPKKKRVKVDATTATTGAGAAATDAKSDSKL